MSAHDTLVTTGVVAKRLGIPRWRLTYLLESGQVPEPSHRIPGRRLFTEEDVSNIGKALDHKPALRSIRKLPSSSSNHGGTIHGVE